MRHLIRILIITGLLLIAHAASAQQGNTVIRLFPGAPSGTCSPIQIAVNQANGDFYDCLSGAWNLVTGGGGATTFLALTDTPASYAGAGGECVKVNAGTTALEFGPCAAGGGYATIQEDGTPLTQRTVVNFTGAGVTCVDDAGNTRTNCDVPGGGSTTFDLVGTGTNTTATMTLGTGGTLTFSGSGVVNASQVAGNNIDAATSSGQIPIYDSGTNTYIPGDPLVQGLTAHDAIGTSTNPVAIGGYSSAAAPADVSADGDIVRAWMLRNGSQVVNLAAGGTLITATGASLNANVTNATLAATQSGTWVLGANSGVDIGDVTINNATIAVTQSGTWTLGANSGVDIGDVTINNGAGAAAVNIQDGGNSITVDGTVNIGTFPDNEPFNVAQVGGSSVVSAAAGVQKVGIADGAGNNINSTSNAAHVVIRDAAGNARGANVNAANQMSVNNLNDFNPADGQAFALQGAFRSTGDGNRIAAVLPWVSNGATLDKTFKCDQFTAISTAASGSTQIVALTAAQNIRICHYNFMAAGTVSVKLVLGTGTNCATGPADVTGAYPLIANTGLVANLGADGAIKLTAANALCINLSDAVQVSGVVSYAKY